jgi:hypothetical protein
MKVGKRAESFLYSWLPSGRLHKTLAIWNFKFFEIWQIWAIVFP